VKRSGGPGAEDRSLVRGRKTVGRLAQAVRNNKITSQVAKRENWGGRTTSGGEGLAHKRQHGRIRELCEREIAFWAIEPLPWLANKERDKEHIKV